MYVIRTSADQLYALHQRRELVGILQDAERELGRAESGANEKRAWEHSLPAMARDLVDSGLGAVDMMVECAFPGVQGAADVILAGQHPRTHDLSYVVVELKQWRRVTLAPGSQDRFRVGNFTGKLKKHPAEQTGAFCRALLRSHELFAERDDRLAGLTYLHNAADHDVGDLLSYERTGLSHIFTRDSRGALMRFLRERLAPVPGSPASARFVAAVGPDSGGGNVSEVMRRRGGFPLLSDMTATEQYALDVLRAAYAGDRKCVVAMTGADTDVVGTVTASVTSALRGAGYTCRGLERHGSAEPPESDVLLSAESRLVQTDGWTRPLDGHVGTSALMAELIVRARVPVFFLGNDEGETGSARPRPSDLLRRTAEVMGMPVRFFRLDKEFR
ncbi:hypothetical protein ACH4GK_29575 [Streptomyces rimosus]|uniref:hypothetical protein n=1 Tax=Streptomyces rimosus TaxID=1927 RepID=UPI0004CA56B0|nr:hypothetical protein [Streptomyces rimosus]